MKLQKMSFVGVLTSEKGNMAFIMLKEIFLKEGFIPIYINEEGNIIFLKGKDNYIGLIEITPFIGEGLLKLNLNFQVLVHTFLKEKDYNKKVVQKLFKKAKKVVILNIDEEKSIDLMKENNSDLVVTYGFNKKSTVTASSFNVNNSIDFNFCIQRQLITLDGHTIEPCELPISLDLIGKWNIYHALAAITGSMFYNIKFNTICDALKGVRSSRRIFEKIYQNKFLIIDNDCRNALDFNTTFETIQNLKYKKLIIILGIEIDQGIVSIKENLDIVMNWVPVLGIEKLLLYIDKKNELVKDNINFMLYKKEIDFSLYYNLKQCIEKGIKLLNKDDILLFVGGESLNECGNISKLELANKI